jgi:hypothetical protein
MESSEMLLLGLLSHPSHTCPVTAAPTMGWTFLHQLAVKKTHDSHGIGQPDLSISLLEVPSTQVTLS